MKEGRRKKVTELASNWILKCYQPHSFNTGRTNVVIIIKSMHVQNSCRVSSYTQDRLTKRNQRRGIEAKGLRRSVLYFFRNPNVFKFLFSRLYVVNSHLVERGYFIFLNGKKRVEERRWRTEGLVLFPSDTGLNTPSLSLTDQRSTVNSHENG